MNLIKKFKKSCKYPKCEDEITGLIALLLGLSSYIIQFVYTEQSLDVSSFSIASLVLASLGELLFAIQGYQKQSPTITLTRTGTFIAFSTFVILWLIDHNNIPSSSNVLPN